MASGVEQPSLAPTQPSPLPQTPASRATTTEDATALAETARAEYSELQARARARRDRARLLEDAARYCAAGSPGVDEIRPFFEQQQQRSQDGGRQGLSEGKLLLRLLPRERPDPQRNMLFETGVYQCLKPAAGALEDRDPNETGSLVTGRRPRGPFIPPPSVKRSCLATPRNGADDDFELYLSTLNSSSSPHEQASLVVPKNLAHQFGRRTCDRLISDFRTSKADSSPVPIRFPPIAEHASTVASIDTSSLSRERLRELLAPPTSTAKRAHADPRAHPLHTRASGKHRMRRDEFAAWKQALYVSDHLFEQMNTPSDRSKPKHK